jgi:2-phosphoglycerate kinase
MEPKYCFSKQNTVIFITGVPLSGKSTVTSQVAASIKGCSSQSMDIFRLFAQEFDKLKPENERNPFVRFGSCDSFLNIGDGSYSPANLILGFNKYSEVVSSLLPVVLPKMETQGVRDAIFEGVQLTPRITEQYLKGNNKLIVLEVDKRRLELNRKERYGDDEVLNERYSTERVCLVQDEIISQTKSLPNNSFKIIKNNLDYFETVSGILKYLESVGVIRQNGA